MSRIVFAAMAVAVAGAATGCYDVPEPWVQPPMPYDVVRHYAEREFEALAARAETRDALGKFLEKSEPVQTRDGLKAFWKECFTAPPESKVLEERVIARSMRDPHWPVYREVGDADIIAAVRDAGADVLGRVAAAQ